MIGKGLSFPAWVTSNMDGDAVHACGASEGVPRGWPRGLGDTLSYFGDYLGLKDFETI